MNIRLIEDFEYELLSGTDDVFLTSLCYDSRKVKENDVFVCLSGSNFDAHTVIEEIIKKQPSLVVVEKDVEVKAEVNIIKVSSGRQALAILSAALFDYPAKKMTMIGVTGTKVRLT